MAVNVILCTFIRLRFIQQDDNRKVECVISGLLVNIYEMKIDYKYFHQRTYKHLCLRESS